MKLLGQSLNSLFRAPYIEVEPWCVKRESRITCMRMLKTNQSETIEKCALVLVVRTVDGIVYAQDFVIYVEKIIYCKLLGRNKDFQHEIHNL